jgi:hypothetical protein
MSFVVYNIHTTITPTTKEFANVGSAKGYITKMVNAGKIDRADYSVADSSFFYNNIEKYVERVNMMSGKTYKESINTPVHMSPAYETYWSM